MYHLIRVFVCRLFVVCSSFVHRSFIIRSLFVRSFVVRSAFVRLAIADCNVPPHPQNIVLILICRKISMSAKYLSPGQVSSSLALLLCRSHRPCHRHRHRSSSLSLYSPLSSSSSQSGWLLCNWWDGHVIVLILILILVSSLSSSSSCHRHHHHPRRSSKAVKYLALVRRKISMSGSFIVRSLLVRRSFDHLTRHS